jgi:hypothetical protein
MALFAVKTEVRRLEILVARPDTVDESDATVVSVVASPDVRVESVLLAIAKREVSVAMLAICLGTVGERPATTLVVDCKSEVEVEIFPFAVVTLLESVDVVGMVSPTSSDSFSEGGGALERESERGLSSVMSPRVTISAWVRSRKYCYSGFSADFIQL